jgi:hypothetical protein
MYLNKKNYTGFNNTDFYNFFYLDILSYILVILSVEYFNLGYFVTGYFVPIPKNTVISYLHSNETSSHIQPL